MSKYIKIIFFWLNVFLYSFQWCKSFGVHKEITFRELKAEQTKINYVVGVNVQRGNGLYSCTTFITLTPRFQLFNRSINRLEFAQKCDVVNMVSLY